MSYTTELDQKWENENGKTSHMKVLMVHDAEECEKECTATMSCIAFTFNDGDLRSQGSQRRCGLGLRWWRDDLRQAGWGEAHTAGTSPELHCVPSLPARSLLFFIKDLPLFHPSLFQPAT